MSGISFPYKTARSVDVHGKQVLMRVDYNVPQNDDGSIADDFRITASLPTIKYLTERGAKVVLISHLGRPDGHAQEKFSLAPIAINLSEKLGQEVKFVPDCIGDVVSVATKDLAAGDVILLENLRFHAEEEQNDRDFAEKLAKDSRANLFVQDGFGVVHRAHASTAAITEFLPSVAGLLLETEYVKIKSATDSPTRPLTAVLGGAKISDKIPLVEKFIEIADNVVIGGAMANNFLKYLGYDVGESLVESDVDDITKKILDKAHAKFGDAFDEKFLLPIDLAVAEQGSPDENRTELPIDTIHGQMKILDIGGKTIDRIDEIVKNSSTVIWNGPLGMAEKPEFAHGSARLAMVLAQHPEVTSVIGGGETADFVRNWDVKKGDSFTHVSTGGGASLELMADDTLPGIAMLMSRN
ncbi:MAG: phosphoglycerate kinase [Candidatus Nomurabacteria bacterium]|jgi:3-phosphoglycerate kinase|nr:phosphoglycerate kinase [Candidatus Nomurabacteria bacterium]